MAKGLNMPVNLQLNTGQAAQQLRDFSRQMTEITRAQGSSMSLGITAELKESVKTAQLLKESLAQATNASTGAFDLSKFNASINQTIGGIDKVKSALTSLGPSGEKAFNSLSMQIAQASVPMKQTSGMLSELKNSFANSFRWSLTSGAIRKVTSEVQKAFSYAQNLDKSLTNIQIVTGHGANYMKNFATQANAAAKALSASTLEYTNAALIYYQQGLGDKEVAKRAETTVKMAKVTGQTASTISQQMTSVWNNFSNGLDNLERYADVMTALGASTASSSAEIAKGLEKFSSVTKTIGLSYDYAASALATVTAQTRQSADSVGTSFKTLFSRLESLKLGDTLDDGVSLNKYSQALATVGVNVLDVNGQLRSMDTILDDLAGRWDHLNNAQQVALAQTVGGVRNYTSLITLMSNWEQFQTNLTTARLSEGTLQKQADIYAKSWEAAQQRVTTSTQTLYQSIISSDFFKGLNNLTSGVLNMAGKIGQVLGSSGSFSGLSMLTNMLFKDKLTGAFNGLENNLMMNTNAGRAWYKQQQMDLLAETRGAYGSSRGSYLNDNRDAILEKMATESGRTAAAQQAGRPSLIGRIFRGERGPSEAQRNANVYSLSAIRAQGTQVLNSLVDADQAHARAQAIMNDRALQWMAAGQGEENNTYARWISEETEAGNNLLARGAMDQYASTVQGILHEIDQGGKDLTDTQRAALASQYEDAQKALSDQIDKYGPNNAEAQAYLKSVQGLSAKDIFENKEALATQAVEGKGDTSKLDAQEKEQFNAGRITFTAMNDKNRFARDEKYLTEEEKAKFEAQKPKGQTFGQFTMGMAQAINTTNMFVNSMESLTKSIADGNFNMSSLISTAGSGMMMASMWGQQFGGPQAKLALQGPLANSGFGKGIASMLGQRGIDKGLVSSTGVLTGAGGSAIMMGAMAALLATKYIVQIAKTMSLDSRIERANEDRLTATSQAKEAKQKSDNFLTAANAQNDAVNKLTQLQKGTTEYTTQLIASNNQARELIDTYNLQAEKDYTIDRTTGAVRMTAKQVQEVNERLLQESLEASTRAQLATSKFNQLTYKQQLQNVNAELLGVDMALHPENYDYISTYGVDTSKEHIEELQNQKKDIELRMAADYQAAVASYVSSQEGTTAKDRLTADILSANADVYGEEYHQALTRAGAWGGETHRATGGYRSIKKLRKKYKELLGVEPSADMSQAELAAAIEATIAENAIEEQFDALFSNEKVDTNKLSAMFTSFDNYASLSFEKLNELLTSDTFDIDSIEDEATRQATRDAYNALVSTVLKNRANTMDQLTESILSITDIDQGYDIDAEVSELAKTLSIDQMTSLSNMISSFGTNFGKQTGQAVYQQLMQKGTLDTNLLSYLQTHNFENSISGYAAIMRDIDLQGGKNSLTGSLTAIRKAILDDINSRGSLAKTLFESSEFQDVFESLRDTYWQTGNITSQNIADLATKNQILADYLTATGGNTEAVATMAELIASGTISSGELTKSVADAITTATESTSMQQRGIDTMNNQNLSDSVSSMDKYFQNIGSAYYNAVQHDMLNDRPVQEGLESILRPEDYQKYQQILAWGAAGHSTAEMVKKLQEELPNVYELLQALQGKKGKGGGGATNAYTYLAKSGALEGSGIVVDDNGRISFDESFISGYGGTGEQTITSQGLRDYIIHQLADVKHFSQEYAENYADQMMATLASSSFGTILAQGDASQATIDLLTSLNSENPENRTNFLTEDQINAMYQANMVGLSTMVIKDDVLQPATEEQIKNGEAGVSPEEYARFIRQNMGSALYIQGSASEIQDAAKGGVGALGEFLAAGDSSIVGANGIEQLIDAARRAGVDIAEDGAIDFQKLKDFYTNILGISEDDFLKHVESLMHPSDENTKPYTFRTSYLDRYGYTHSLNSSDYDSAEEYQRAISEEENTRNSIEEYRRARYIEQLITEHPDWSTDRIMQELAAQEDVWREQARVSAEGGEANYNTETIQGTKATILESNLGWGLNDDTLQRIIAENTAPDETEADAYARLLTAIQTGEGLSDFRFTQSDGSTIDLGTFLNNAAGTGLSALGIYSTSDENALKEALGLDENASLTDLYSALQSGGYTTEQAIKDFMTAYAQQKEFDEYIAANQEDWTAYIGEGNFGDNLEAFKEWQAKRAEDIALANQAEMEAALDYAQTVGEANDAQISAFLTENSGADAAAIREWADELAAEHAEIIKQVKEEFNWSQDDIDAYFEDGGEYAGLVGEARRRKKEAERIAAENEKKKQEVMETWDWSQEEVDAYLAEHEGDYEGLNAAAEKSYNERLAAFQNQLANSNVDTGTLATLKMAPDALTEEQLAALGLTEEEARNLNPDQLKAVDDYLQFLSGNGNPPSWLPPEEETPTSEPTPESAPPAPEPGPPPELPPETEVEVEPEPKVTPASATSAWARGGDFAGFAAAVVAAKNGEGVVPLLKGTEEEEEEEEETPEPVIEPQPIFINTQTDLQNRIQGYNLEELETFLDSKEYNNLTPDVQNMVDNYYYYRTGSRVLPDWTTEETEQRARAVESFNTDLSTYQSGTIENRMNMVADALAAFQNNPDTMTPFQKAILVAATDLVDIGEENRANLEASLEQDVGAENARKATNNIDAEGNPLDENGQPVQTPDNSGNNQGNNQPSTGGGKPRNIPTSFTIGDDGSYVGLLPDGTVVQRDDQGNWVPVPPQNPSTTTTGAASGRNNHLLSFASGGEIAVTGELGPELRIKEDGSADLLGKRGREYAWINPGDRVYTATQTAGILGNNSIPALQGLAKGIRNHIPGYYTPPVKTSTDKTITEGQYSSDPAKGGSGGDSSNSSDKKKDPRYDPNTLKIRDVLERYYTILQKIEDITRAVEKFSKVADRAWGKDRIKAIEKQSDLLKQQYDAQKKYVNEIAGYYDTDKNALTTMISEFVTGYNKGKDKKDQISWSGAQFDENGVLTNYTEFVQYLVKQYNQNAEKNAQDKEAQYKFQQQLADIQKYTETLQLWKTETDKLDDLAHQILDNSLKTITYRVEYELELNNDLKSILKFNESFVKDDPFHISDYIANLNAGIKNTKDSLDKTRQGIFDYLGKLAGDDLRIGPEHTMQELGIKNADGSINKKADMKKVSSKLNQWIKDLEANGGDAEAVKKIIKYNKDGTIANYEEVLNQLNEMNSKLSKKAQDLFINDTEEFFKKLSDTNNVNWEGLTDEQKTQLTTWRDQAIQLLDESLDQYKEIVESLGDVLKTFSKQIDHEIDEFAYFEDVYKHFGDIVDLTNQSMTDVTSDFFKTLSNRSVNNSINKIKAMRDNYELMSQSLGQVSKEYEEVVARRDKAFADPKATEETKAYYQQQVDLMKEQMDTVNEQMENAHKDYLQSWQDALSKISEAYKDTVEQAAKDFEKNMSPLFSTLELLQAQFDREKKLEELYVADYQRIHDLNRLNRDIENSILDTDNLRGKQRLRDLQKEINDLQAAGTELSEYDLDILDKKYKLELARQALEDAKDAKSMVRLARDNNGNWSYIYTSNEDDVSKAEQDYEDAVRDMEEANENYIRNIQDQILQVQQEAQQAIQNLNPADMTEDEYRRAINAIVESANQQMNFLQAQAGNLFGNQGWLEGYVPGIINRDNLTDTFGKTTLASLLGEDDLSKVVANAKNNLINNLVNPALTAWSVYMATQREAYNAANYSMENIGQTFSAEMDDINAASNKQVTVVEELTDRIGNEYTKAVENASQAIDEWIDQNQALIKQTYELIAAINKLKELDGDQTEPEVYRSGNNLTKLADIEKFQTALYTAGRLKLITTDKNGKEHAQIVTRGSREEQTLYESAMKANIIKLSDPITSAENTTVRGRIESYGVVYVKYKDKEYSFNSLTSWNEFYNKHKKQEAPAAPSGGGGGGGGSRWHNVNIHVPGSSETVQAQSEHDQAYWDNMYQTNPAQYRQEWWVLSGGYTGRWQSGLTGMYTGEWPSGSVGRNGRLAFLHQKELVLNAHDTENFLDAMKIVRQLDNLTNWMANGLGDLIMPKVTAGTDTLEQDVTIHAEFPNVTDHTEIEQAFDNLVNKASQYANR